MLTKTTEVGLQVLIYLAQRKAQYPVSPRRLAPGIGLSPSYLAKVTAQLVRANLLVARHGAVSRGSRRRQDEVGGANVQTSLSMRR